MVETIAAILTLWCVWLTSKKRIESWPVGIVAIVLYSIIFFEVKLYADFFLQIIFLVQSFYGWYDWSHHRDQKKGVMIGTLNSLNRAHSVGAILFLYITISQILIHYTDASVPYADAFLTSICIVANFLLSKRYVENWYLWIFADILYVGLFAYKGLYVSSALYMVLGIIATRGMLVWTKQLNVQDGNQLRSKEFGTSSI